MEPRTIAQMKANLGLMLVGLRETKGWTQQQMRVVEPADLRGKHELLGRVRVELAGFVEEIPGGARYRSRTRRSGSLRTRMQVARRTGHHRAGSMAESAGRESA